MKKLIVLDFNTGECHIHPIEDGLDGEEIMEELGFNVNNCQWMVTGESIIIH